MHDHSIEIENFPAREIFMNQWALHCDIIALSFLNISSKTLCVVVNVIHDPIIYGSYETLFTYKCGYMWELVINDTGTRTSPVLLCPIMLKLFIFMKVLRMGIIILHLWRVCNRSWSADWRKVTWAHDRDNNRSCRILAVIFSRIDQLRIM